MGGDLTDLFSGLEYIVRVGHVTGGGYQVGHATFPFLLFSFVVVVVVVVFPLSLVALFPFYTGRCVSCLCEVADGG
jgi:hypothetical protein